MPTFVSLLRGINVGGQRKIRMGDLRGACEAIGLTDVETYVQSGNIVFASVSLSVPEMRDILERQIAKCFGYEVSVFIRTAAELAHLVDANPFASPAAKDPAKVHVTFLQGRPTGAVVKGIKTPAGCSDAFVVHRKEVYLHCPDGYGRTKLNNAFLERRLGMPATTRNWRTVVALRDMACG